MYRDLFCNYIIVILFYDLILFYLQMATRSLKLDFFFQVCHHNDRDSEVRYSGARLLDPTHLPLDNFSFCCRRMPLDSVNVSDSDKSNVSPFISTLKPHSNGPLYSDTVIGTLTVDGYAVTFGTARRGLGGLGPRPVPSSLYQM